MDYNFDPAMNSGTHCRACAWSLATLIAKYVVVYFTYLLTKNEFRMEQKNFDFEMGTNSGESSTLSVILICNKRKAKF